jgi:hypothetical protein
VLPGPSSSPKRLKRCPHLCAHAQHLWARGYTRSTAAHDVCGTSAPAAISNLNVSVLTAGGHRPTTFTACVGLRRTQGLVDIQRGRPGVPHSSTWPVSVYQPQRGGFDLLRALCEGYSVTTCRPCSAARRSGQTVCRQLHPHIGGCFQAHRHMRCSLSGLRLIQADGVVGVGACLVGVASVTPHTVCQALRQGQTVNKPAARTLALGTWIRCDLNCDPSTAGSAIVIGAWKQGRGGEGTRRQDPFPPDTRDHLLPH